MATAPGITQWIPLPYGFLKEFLRDPLDYQLRRASGSAMCSAPASGRRSSTSSITRTTFARALRPPEKLSARLALSSAA